MKHTETHPNLDVEGCFGCKVAGVRMGANSTTTRGSRVMQANQTEAGWNKDMPAYKRLRQQGYQPAQIDGCAKLEQTATSVAEVESRPDVEKLVARGIADA